MKNEEQANAELARISLAGNSVQGSYVETENRVKNDRLLLNAIESERDERMEATREIYDKLRKHEVALNFAIGLAVGLLISMILIAWQTLN
ncbi:hypothetical protein DWV22_09765 [Weissella confusa]|uniref:hypothetical protein n=1 Tax=Weissella confusa TaxID=1583 RepID=UPI000E516DF5|nr:hypothetical protein [Weissella confusa]RGX44631.1 hypothetical protein DWV22_09765 [Weissella confusa]